MNATIMQAPPLQGNSQNQCLYALERTFWAHCVDHLRQTHTYGVRIRGKYLIVRPVREGDCVPDKKISADKYGEPIPMDDFHKKIQTKLTPFFPWWRGAHILSPKNNSYREGVCVGWVSEGLVAVCATSCWAIVHIQNALVDMHADLWTRLTEMDETHIGRLLQLDTMPAMYLSLIYLHPSSDGKEIDRAELVFRNSITWRLSSWSMPIGEILEMSECYRKTISGMITKIGLLNPLGQVYTFKEGDATEEALQDVLEDELIYLYANKEKFVSLPETTSEEVTRSGDVSMDVPMNVPMGVPMNVPMGVPMGVVRSDGVSGEGLMKPLPIPKNTKSDVRMAEFMPSTPRPRVRIPSASMTRRTMRGEPTPLQRPFACV